MSRGRAFWSLALRTSSIIDPEARTASEWTKAPAYAKARSWRSLQRRHWHRKLAARHSQTSRRQSLATSSAGDNELVRVGTTANLGNHHLSSCPKTRQRMYIRAHLSSGMRTAHLARRRLHGVIKIRSVRPQLGTSLRLNSPAGIHFYYLHIYL